MLSANEIWDRIRRKALVKSEAVSLLKVLIENNKGTKKRAEGMKILEKISPKDIQSFKFLENLFLSDWNPYVRHATLRILIHNFPHKSIPALKWVLNSKRWLPSIILKTILDELEFSGSRELNELRAKFVDRLEKRYQLKYIDAKALLDLHFLLEHDSEEKLSENPPFITAPTENGRLTGLGLSHQDLEEVPEIIRSFSKLKFLDLRENNLTSLPDWICQFKDLECLLVGGNSFTSLPKCLLNHNLLDRLGYYSDSHEVETILEVVVEFATQKCAKRYIQLGIVPEDAQILGLLETLSSGTLEKVKELKRPNDSHSGCSRFKTDKNGHVIGIYIIGGEVDRIKIIPNQIGNLTYLEELDLSSNQIRKLPESIGNLSALKKLKLRLNEIQSIPLSIGKLKSLKRLDLSCNQIHEIPESIGSLSSLKYLDLYDNKIQEISGSLYKLTSLKVINLSHNKISEKGIEEIEKKIKQVVDNHEIKMAEEQGIEIESFRGTIIAKSEVRILQTIEKFTKKEFEFSYELWTDWMSFTVENLYVTGICLFDSDSAMSFPISILELKFLKKLYLIGLNLTILPEDIDKLVHLRKLNLRANLLKTLPISIGNLSSLKELDLSENNLSTFPRSICNLKSLTDIHIDYEVYSKFHKTLKVLEESGVIISK